MQWTFKVVCLSLNSVWIKVVARKTNIKKILSTLKVPLWERLGLLRPLGLCLVCSNTCESFAVCIALGSYAVPTPAHIREVDWSCFSSRMCLHDCKHVEARVLVPAVLFLANHCIWYCANPCQVCTWQTNDCSVAIDLRIAAKPCSQLNAVLSTI